MHKTQLHIRFTDIDAFGHVNNALYLTYFEEARVKYFDDVLNWGYDWTKEGVIVARAELNFIIPAHFKDEIFIYTKCSRLGTKSFDLSYQMVKFHEEKEILLADAVTVMVAFDYSSNKSIPIPDDWRTALQNTIEK